MGIFPTLGQTDNLNKTFKTVIIDNLASVLSSASRTASTALTGSTSEVALATVTIPADTVGPTDRVQFIGLYSATGAAGTKSTKIKTGTGISGTAFGTIINAASTLSVQCMWTIWGLAAGSQITAGNGANSGYGSSGAATIALALDWTVEQTFTFVGQLGNAADSLTMLAYEVTIIKGP